MQHYMIKHYQKIKLNKTLYERKNVFEQVTQCLSSIFVSSTSLPLL